jgi:putative sigma-54 modulation protein
MKKAIARPRSTPVPTIEITGPGLAITPALRAHVVERLQHALLGVHTNPVHVRVAFTDVNGPKGGLDVRCAIDVSIPQSPPLHTEEFAVRGINAFDRSAAAITRQIAQQLERRQQSARRPKKYYAAKRLQ